MEDVLEEGGLPDEVAVALRQFLQDRQRGKPPRDRRARELVRLQTLLERPGEKREAFLSACFPVRIRQIKKRVDGTFDVDAEVLDAETGAPLAAKRLVVRRDGEVLNAAPRRKPLNPLTARLGR